VKNEICKDLKSLGVDLTPEELERLNDESEYPAFVISYLLSTEAFSTIGKNFALKFHLYPAL